MLIWIIEFSCLQYIYFIWRYLEVDNHEITSLFNSNDSSDCFYYTAIIFEINEWLINKDIWINKFNYFGILEIIFRVFLIK